MIGGGLNIMATDRAPYAMLGMRLTRRISTRVSVFGEWRVHTRPPVKLPTAGRAFAGPLEHNSKDQTLRFGLQIDLGR